MNEHSKKSIDNNKYLHYLNNLGIENDRVKESVFDNYDESCLEAFINNYHGLLSPNTYVESLVYEEVCKYLHSDDEFRRSVIFEDTIRIDVRTIIAVSNSLIQRPNLPRPSDTVEGFREPYEENEFVTVSRFEKELVTDDYGGRRQHKVCVAFEGLLPKKIEVNPLPERGHTNNIWLDEYYCHQQNIQGFNTNFNSIESNYVLWMNSTLLNTLGLKLDEYNSGLRALNSDNEIVLIYRCWRDQLIGNGSSFVGTNSNIAKLEGCDLILRKDYFDRVKKIIPNVVYYTKVR